MAAESATAGLERLFTFLLRTNAEARDDTIRRAFAAPPGQNVTKWWKNNSPAGWGLLLTISLREGPPPASMITLLLDKDYVELRGALATLVLLPSFRLVDPHHREVFDLLLSRTADESPSDLSRCAGLCTDALCRDAILKRLSQPSRAMAAQMAAIDAAAQAREETAKKKKRKAPASPQNDAAATDGDDDDDEEEWAPSPKKPAKDRTASAAPSGPPLHLDSLLAELDDLLGLASAKARVREIVIEAKVSRERLNMGHPPPSIPESGHLIFYGNPGTGKTMMAKLIGKIFGALGVLKKGHIIEATRATLIAPFDGQTAPLVTKVVTSALDGILFIDEAYSLHRAGEDAYGAEAVATLLPLIDENRDRLIVIMAGYRSDMDRFLATNAGFVSRFNHFIEFEDYSDAELTSIIQAIAKQNHFQLSSAALLAMGPLLQEVRAVLGKGFANGRTARNVFFKAKALLNSRVHLLPERDLKILTTIEVEDLPLANAMRGIH